LKYFFSLIDFAFSDFKNDLNKVLLNFLGLLSQIKIGLLSYSGTLENIETLLPGTCSDTICNFFSLSLFSMFLTWLQNQMHRHRDNIYHLYLSLLALTGLNLLYDIYVFSLLIK
jgi:hypothetical protein